MDQRIEELSLGFHQSPYIQEVIELQLLVGSLDVSYKFLLLSLSESPIYLWPFANAFFLSPQKSGILQVSPFCAFTVMFYFKKLITEIANAVRTVRVLKFEKGKMVLIYIANAVCTVRVLIVEKLQRVLIYIYIYMHTLQIICNPSA